MHFSYALSLLALPALIAGQLSGKTGPLTSRADKSTRKCSVLDYGAKADKSTDLGPALLKAFDACKTGGTVVIPSGNYALKTFVELKNGAKWALQLDGIIYRTGTAAGNMLAIKGGSDFELFSSTSKGAIQGYGYEFHKNNEYGPRILRLTKVTNFSVHDIALVDSPAFHMTLDTCENGEVYNTIIRGGNKGGLDGIDVWGKNNWIHDVEITNKDECVNIKNPSSNILVENIYCNWSGGSAMGSLSTGTAIENIHYRNVYTSRSNQMFMFKSNGGDGLVSGVTLENFIGHSNAYSFTLNSKWSSMSPVAGDGIQYENITISKWRGTAENGMNRGPVNILCPSKVPCTDIKVDDFAMWTEAGSKIKYVCENGYGSGACLKSGSGGAYSATQTVSSAPAGHTAAKMADDLTAGLGLSVSIAIPAVPTSYFPGLKPATALLGAKAAKRAEPTAAFTA